MNTRVGRPMTQASIQAQRRAEEQYPVRVRIAVPQEGLGRQLEIMHAWLDEICGVGGWATGPATTGSVGNDAIALYFENAAFARAFVIRFCCGYRIETIAGAFIIRTDARVTRRNISVHKTP
jgi:hypothetical protein